MSTMIPAADGWWASRRFGGEIETRKVLAFALSEPQAPVVPIVLGDDGVASQDPSWVVWNEGTAEPPVWVVEQLAASVEEWSPAAPAPAYGHSPFPVITPVLGR